MHINFLAVGKPAYRIPLRVVSTREPFQSLVTLRFPSFQLILGNNSDKLAHLTCRHSKPSRNNIGHGQASFKWGCVGFYYGPLWALTSWALCLESWPWLTWGYPILGSPSLFKPRCSVVGPPLSLWRPKLSQSPPACCSGRNNYECYCQVFPR